MIPVLDFYFETIHNAVASLSCLFIENNSNNNVHKILFTRKYANTGKPHRRLAIVVVVIHIVVVVFPCLFFFFFLNLNPSCRICTCYNTLYKVSYNITSLIIACLHRSNHYAIWILSLSLHRKSTFWWLKVHWKSTDILHAQQSTLNNLKGKEKRSRYSTWYYYYVILLIIISMWYYDLLFILLFSQLSLWLSPFISPILLLLFTCLVMIFLWNTDKYYCSTVFSFLGS